MINNYFTLKALSREFNVLCGSKLIESYSQEKNVLILNFFDGTDSKFIQFSTDTKFSNIQLKNQFFRARKNSTDLFSNLCGEYLNSISMSETDRVIYFNFVTKKLAFVFFGASKNNAFLLQENIILDSFKSSKKYENSLYEISASVTSSESPEDKTIGSLLKHYPQLGKTLLSDLISQSDNSDLTMLIKSYYEDLNEFKKAYILMNQNQELILSLRKLKAYPVIIEEHESINTCLQIYLGKKLSLISFSGSMKSARSRIERELNFFILKLLSILDSTEDIKRSEKYENWGNLLVSQPNIKEKLGNEIRLFDFNNNLQIIPLKLEQNLLENGIRYLEKSKKIIRSLAEKQKKKSGYDQKINKLLELKEKIEKANKVKEIEMIMDENKDILGYSQKDEKSEDQRFRKFELGEGYTLYVGKNASNNDELTMHFAKPNDLWFHARGSSGSHAVLRLDKNARPPKHILQKAASITAYYSGAKNAKYTPVAYTYKKYVHKPKGANPGSVVISKEDVILVEPKLPIE